MALLESRGILRTDDQPLLAQYCADWSDIVLARRQMYDLGEKRLLVKTETGHKVNPLMRLIDVKTESLAKISARFGFSPADRARLAFDDFRTSTRGTPLEELLAGPPESDPDDTAIDTAIM